MHCAPQPACTHAMSENTMATNDNVHCTKAPGALKQNVVRGHFLFLTLQKKRHSQDIPRTFPGPSPFRWLDEKVILQFCDVGPVVVRTVRFRRTSDPTRSPEKASLRGGLEKVFSFGEGLGKVFRLEKL